MKEAKRRKRESLRRELKGPFIESQGVPQQTPSHPCCFWSYLTHGIHRSSWFAPRTLANEVPGTLLCSVLRVKSPAFSKSRDGCLRAGPGRGEPGERQGGLAVRTENPASPGGNRKPPRGACQGKNWSRGEAGRGGSPGRRPCACCNWPAASSRGEGERVGKVEPAGIGAAQLATGPAGSWQTLVL